MRIWNAEDGTMVASLPVQFYCRAAVWSPDGTCIATSDPLKIWNAETQTEVMPLERHDVDVLVWSKKGDRILGWRRRVNRDRIVVWIAATGKIESRFEAGGGDVVAAELSPQGDRLAIASPDGKVHLWDVSTGKSLHVFQGLKQPAGALAFSPTGRWLAAGSSAGIFHIWETDSGNEWLKLSIAPVGTMGFSPDERWFMVGGAVGGLFLWPTDPLPGAKARLHRPLTADERVRYQISDDISK